MGQLTSFLNEFLPGRFRLSLAESKVTTLPKELKSAQDFIMANKLCVEMTSSSKILERENENP